MTGGYNPTTFTVNPVGNTLTITTTSLPNGTAGSFYSATLHATGGTTPYTWSLASGDSLGAVGLTLNVATGVISGTPTSATTLNFTVQVDDSASHTATRPLSITINTPGTNNPPVAESLNVTATSGVTTTITLKATDPDAGDTIASYAIVDHPIYGTVTVSGNQATYTPPTNGYTGLDPFTYKAIDNHGAESTPATVNITVTAPTAIVIDDFEGGCVKTNGYYVFENCQDITPTNESINSQLRKGEAKDNGNFGAKVRYSYVGTDGSDWGGGWGAQLIKTLDLEQAKSITMNVKWDGSDNDMIFSLKDSDGTTVNGTVANATLKALGGYGQITIDRANFAINDAGADSSFDWAQVISYNFIFNTKLTTSNYMYLDDITAQLGQVIPPLSGNTISVSPKSGPVGTVLTISWVKGNTFGSYQGNSIVMFTNKATGVTSANGTILSWSETQIKVVVPQLAAGQYDVAVRVAQSASGTVQPFTTDPDTFQVYAGGGADTPSIYPNPFDPGKETVTIALTDTKGASNIDYYIYDMTARLAHRVTGGGTQITWDGRDLQGGLAANGAYLVRIVNADTRSLIARGKLLVIRH